MPMRNHRICGECWVRRELDARTHRFPVCADGESSGTCCYCGGSTRLGIYLRAQSMPFCEPFHQRQLELGPEAVRR
jgi:hypothetical protein